MPDLDELVAGIQNSFFESDLVEATAPGVAPENRAELLREAADIAENHSRSEDAIFLRGRAARIEESGRLLDKDEVPNEDLRALIDEEVRRVQNWFELE